MPITINSEDPRSIKAIEIAATSGQWLKCKTRDGSKRYGIPASGQPGRYYLVDQQSCDCQDAQRHPSQPCKHQLAVRLVVELAKAQQPKRRGKVLRMVREEDGSLRWEPEPRSALTAADYDRIVGAF